MTILIGSLAQTVSRVYFMMIVLVIIIAVLTFCYYKDIASLKNDNAELISDIADLREDINKLKDRHIRLYNKTKRLSNSLIEINQRPRNNFYT